ncbi:MAG: hypothetical protein EXR36_11255 [Betaproteobacteria bacterium]|nr:hypothetical protein [Betaproteobacteria bacterium]
MLLQSLGAAAEPYPSRPIKIVVPFPAGGVVDIWVRRIGDLVARDLGQPVIVEIRPGASGTIGAAYVASAKPDGYTLLTGSSTLFSVLAATGTKLPFDIDRSFTPIQDHGRHDPALSGNSMERPPPRRSRPAPQFRETRRLSSTPLLPL